MITNQQINKTLITTQLFINFLKNTKMNNSTKIAVGVAAGAISGALAGVLFAPKSGKETRQEIAETTNGVINLAKDASLETLKNMQNTAETTLRNIQTSAGETLQQLADKTKPEETLSTKIKKAAEPILS